MFAVVAVPCLDEQANVGLVCRSLGFGAGADRPCVEAALVLVDNGSADGTLAAMAQVARESPVDRVRVEREPSRGYVPARHRGALEARRLASERGLREDEVLLVQADADTIYGSGYLAAMVEASLVAGPGVLVEGYSEAPTESNGRRGYYGLERRIDEVAASALCGDEFDVIVDDKVAAFRLSDYFAWGGHRREYGADGDEILAETTRLFIRARLGGGMRVHAEGASATTSQRRTFENPGLALATAGFPRGPRWRTAWARSYRGPTTVEGFNSLISSEDCERLVHARLTHLFGMFNLMPEWIDAAIRELGEQRPDRRLRSEHLSASPLPAVGARHPAAVVEWALSRPWQQVAKALAGRSALEVERLVAACARGGDYA